MRVLLKLCFMRCSATVQAKALMDIGLVSLCQMFQHSSSRNSAKAARYGSGTSIPVSAHRSSEDGKMSSQVMAATVASQARS